MGKYKIIAATGCPTGVAHTYMAQEALEKAAKERNVSIKVETHGQVGIENALTKQEISDAEIVIIASDKDVNSQRFAGKKVINVSVSRGIKEPDKLINDAIAGKGKTMSSNNQSVESEDNDYDDDSLTHKIYKHLMNGVSHMLPFVVAGGVLIAISFLWGIYSADPSSDQYNEFASLLNQIGGFSMGLMVPVFSGYIAESIARRPGLVAGFVGGMIAHTTESGFIGGLISGFLGGLIILMLEKGFAFLPKSLDGMKAIFLYPVIGVLLTGLLMFLTAGPVATINDTMMNFLANMEGANPLLLGIIVGCMAAFDMGGPVNKAVYVTGTALLGQGNYTFMAGVSAACIAPPLMTTVAVILFGDSYTKEERNAGYINFILGSTHITEGAIPFAVTNPLLNLPSIMAGSSVAAIITYLFRVEVPAPHGGFLVLPVVTHGLRWVLAIGIGSIIGGILLGFIKKRTNQSNSNTEKAQKSLPQVESTDHNETFTDLVDDSLFIMNLENSEKNEVLAELLNQPNINCYVNDSDKVLNEALAREEQSTTGLGDHIAIPHAKSIAIDEPLVIFGRSQEGVNWDSLDNELVNIIFFILVPEERKGDLHLKILQKLSRKLVNEDFKSALLEAQTKDEVIDLLNTI